MSRVSRALSYELVRRVERGEVVLLEHDGGRQFGVQDPRDPLHVTVTIRDEGFHRRLLRGSIGLATSYADGMWNADDLVALIRIAARNVHRFDRMRDVFRPIIVPSQAVTGMLRRNSVKRSQGQIAAHYDLGNALYELFLDETMLYSAADFSDPAATLHEAQLAKLDRICRRLQLSRADHLLEIGTGWGALAVHAASRYGCRVTTTTISAEQHALASERVRAAGLQDRVAVLRQDYRELEGRYDKLVSIEMIEAVGFRDFGTYFRRCSELLTDRGLMLLQAITIDDRAYEAEKAAKSFINSLVFPGGCLPSQAVIARCLRDHTDLRAIGLEDLTAHYVTTLQHWRARFLAATDALEARGYDERFRRLWELYLCYCEAGFAERRIAVEQRLLAKPGFRAEALAPSTARAPLPSPSAAAAASRALLGA